MCFFLKKIVVCSCNIFFDFFLRCTILSGNTMYNFVRQHYVNVLTFVKIVHIYNI